MNEISASRQRRPPVPRDRYRAAARRSGVRAQFRASRRLDVAILVATGLFVLLASPRVADALGTGVGDLGASLAQTFPSAQGSRSIDLPNNVGTVTAEPVLQGLPDFTNQPALALTGRVPSFALLDGRSVQISLNGAVVADVAPDAAGAFSVPLTLRDGPNTLELALHAGSDIVATSSYVVVLDRQPPALSVSRPAPGATVDGPNVVVEGKAEPGTTITVNDRAVVSAQDGSFTTSFTAAIGAQTVTIVARDRAGNETTVKTPVTVRDASSSAALAVSVTLDRTRVAPGAAVLAEIRVTANGLPKTGQSVTLSVGVITIGSAVTDASGVAHIGFAAPPNEGEAAVVVLADGASGRATLTVAK